MKTRAHAPFLPLVKHQNMELLLDRPKIGRGLTATPYKILIGNIGKRVVAFVTQLLTLACHTHWQHIEPMF